MREQTPMLEMRHYREKRESQALGDRSARSNLRGFTIVELLIVVLVGSVLTAISIPLYKTAMMNMQLNSMSSAITGAISQTRYAAIMNAQVYTLAITAPANTYVVSNVTEVTINAAVPLPTKAIAVNGGTSATYTFTMCPNGSVYGAGGICVNPTTTPPALSVSNNGSQINIAVSGVGNVTTTRVQ
ncbi:MAG TPA: prepilin-type N-terminal cleavage/methylation domain-containing protein [Terriglobales bacterium]|nr:prepilin-type N-terminal cleavage/methylation domain-containing protein [Terriglobales bacterium]